MYGTGSGPLNMGRGVPRENPVMGDQNLWPQKKHNALFKPKNDKVTPWLAIIFGLLKKNGLIALPKGGNLSKEEKFH